MRVHMQVVYLGSELRKDRPGQRSWGKGGRQLIRGVSVSRLALRLLDIKWGRVIASGHWVLSRRDRYNVQV